MHMSRALVFLYLTTGWADELVKLRVDLTTPLKKSILDVVVEQLSLGKQPPPVKFMLKHKCWKRSKGPQTPYRGFFLKTSIRATVTEGSPAQVAQLQCSRSRPFSNYLLPRERSKITRLVHIWISFLTVSSYHKISSPASTTASSTFPPLEYTGENSMAQGNVALNPLYCGWPEVHRSS